MAKIPERKSVKDKYKWNLCDLVNGDEAWEEKYNELSKKAPSLQESKGKLGNDDVLLEFLKKQDRKSTRLNSSHRLESRMPSSA